MARIDMFIIIAETVARIAAAAGSAAVVSRDAECPDDFDVLDVSVNYRGLLVTFYVRLDCMRRGENFLFMQREWEVIDNIVTGCDIAEVDNSLHCITGALAVEYDSMEYI